MSGTISKNSNGSAEFISRPCFRTALVTVLAATCLIASLQNSAMAKDAVFNCALNARASTDNSTWKTYPTQVNILTINEGRNSIVRKDNIDLIYNYVILKNDSDYIYAIYEDLEIKEGNMSFLVLKKAKMEYQELSTSKFGQTFLYGNCQ